MTTTITDNAPVAAGAADDVAPTRPAGAPDDVAPLAGDWTIYRAAELHASLKAMVAGGADRFDLGGVGEFDSSGVQLLLATRRSVANAGRQAEFVNAPDSVREVLRAYALEPILGAPAQEHGQ